MLYVERDTDIIYDIVYRYNIYCVDIMCEQVDIGSSSTIPSLVLNSTIYVLCYICEWVYYWGNKCECTISL